MKKIALFYMILALILSNAYGQNLRTHLQQLSQEDSWMDAHEPSYEDIYEAVKEACTIIKIEDFHNATLMSDALRHGLLPQRLHTKKWNKLIELNIAYGFSKALSLGSESDLETFSEYVTAAPSYRKALEDCYPNPNDTDRAEIEFNHIFETSAKHGTIAVNAITSIGVGKILGLATKAHKILRWVILAGILAESTDLTLDAIEENKKLIAACGHHPDIICKAQYDFSKNLKEISHEK